MSQYTCNGIISWLQLCCGPFLWILFKEANLSAFYSSLIFLVHWIELLQPCMDPNFWLNPVIRIDLVRSGRCATLIETNDNRETPTRLTTLISSQVGLQNTNQNWPTGQH